MAGQRAIKWTNSNIARLERVTKELNKLVRRKAVKSAPDIFVSAGKKNIKAAIYSQQDLLDYERIVSALAKGDLKKRKTSAGVEYTKAGQAVAAVQNRIVNRKMKREAEKFGIDIDARIGDASRPLTETAKQFIPRKEAPKAQKFKTQTGYIASLRRLATKAKASYYEDKMELYHANMLKALENKETGLTEHDAKFLAVLIQKLTPFELVRLSVDNPFFDFNYIYSSVESAIKTETVSKIINDYLESQNRKGNEYVPEEYS